MPSLLSHAKKGWTRDGGLGGGGGGGTATPAQKSELTLAIVIYYYAENNTISIVHTYTAPMVQICI